jgi:Nucleotidyltransferase domain.
MVNRIAEILDGNKASVCLFGSVVLNDFKLGWSDIDFICLTEKSLSTLQATELVNLREKMMREYEGNPYFRLFEGGGLSLNHL